MSLGDLVSIAAVGVFVLVASTPAGAERLQPCKLAGLEEQALCGSLTVPEDRKLEEGRTIELFFAILPATGSAPRPDPMFVLQGGPGQSAVEKASYYARFLAPLRKQRHVVLLDQRGTGRSNPLDWQPEAGDLFAAPGDYIPRAWVTAALAGLEEQADLRRYTTLEAVEDLEEVRRALGYDRINLYGTSYGSRVVLLYLSRYADRVRSAVLKGVVPLSGVVGEHYARDAQAALELLFADCAGDEACSAAFPRLEATFTGVLAGLDQRPAVTGVTNPLDGTEVDLRITRDSLALVTRVLLYSPASRAQLPAMISQAAQGDYSAWTQLFSRMRLGLSQQLYLGMAMSVLAAEDCPRLGLSDTADESRGTFLGDLFPRHLKTLCEGWPADPLPEGIFEASPVDTPVLLVSGRLDPATPPSWAAEAARALPNSLQLVYPHAGHPGLNFTGLDSLLAAFIDGGTAEGLDVSSVDDGSPIPFAMP